MLIFRTRISEWDKQFHITKYMKTTIEKREVLKVEISYTYHDIQILLQIIENLQKGISQK